MTPVIIASAVADPCPDIEVLYARATGAPPGGDFIGQAFINALRSKVGGRSLGVYSVNYPASSDYFNSASAGASDASAHVQDMAAKCPNTRMVLSGMSQGAGVIALITVPPQPAPGLTFAPMPSEVANHVAAVAVFGNPSRILKGGGPLTSLSPLYGPKTIDLCAPGDPYCSNGSNIFAHGSYVANGMVDQAADFVAGRL